ncbi:MAG: hypothetical protein QG641_57, partial [Candidatus Poribacteria bacterium]|nr:hypothetical protein [Candidatus Poribacteria bacterium]
MIVVSNSSTLMALARIGLFNLLKDIFNIVFIPNAVYDEVVKNGDELPGAKEVLESDWIKVCSVKENESVSSMRNFLDPGESEAIALALETNADWIIIDEKLAREYSRNPVKLNVIGTLGILLIAKERGLISDISSQLDKLSASGFRISRHVYREVLKKACEFKGFIATREVNNESQLWNILNSNPRSFTIHEDIKSIEFIKGVPPIENIKEKGRSFSE